MGDPSDSPRKQRIDSGDSGKNQEYAVPLSSYLSFEIFDCRGRGSFCYNQVVVLDEERIFWSWGSRE